MKKVANREVIMKFRKIDEHTITCELTNADLEEQGINLEDLIIDKEKARDFVEHIVELAKMEVGFVQNSPSLSMQIVNEEDHISIIFSDKQDNHISEIMKQITRMKQMENMDKSENHTIQMQEKQMRSLLEDIFHMSDNAMEHKEADDNNKNPEAIEHNQEDNPTSNSNEELEPRPASIPHARNILYWDNDMTKKYQEQKREQWINYVHTYRFDNLNAIESFCKHIKAEYSVKSHLFKDEENEKYYLVIERGRSGKKRIMRIFYYANEFGTLQSVRQRMLVYCQEHFTCLIKNKAIDTIQKMML